MFIKDASSSWDLYLSHYLETRKAELDPLEPFLRSDEQIKSLVDIGAQKMGWLEKSEILAFALYSLKAGVLEVLYLETHPAYRRQGHMRSLLEAMIQEMDFDKFWLEVHEKNLSAQKLYENIGFIPVGRRPSYYPDEAAAVLMSYGAI